MNSTELLDWRRDGGLKKTTGIKEPDKKPLQARVANVRTKQRGGSRESLIEDRPRRLGPRGDKLST